MGVRSLDLRPRLSPVPLGRDAGRRPLQNVGRVDIDQVIPDPDQPRVEFSEEALDQLLDMNGWSRKELADALRIPQSKVTRALALLTLPEDVQARVAAGDVSARAAYQISRIPDDATRRVLAHQAATNAITHEDAAR